MVNQKKKTSPVKIHELYRGFDMFNSLGLAMGCILLVAGLATGCKPKPSAPAGYFKTPFQNESQFIVEAVASDLAEQMFYARFHRLPDQKHFSVIATEKAGTPLDTAEYELQVRMDSIHTISKVELNLDQPIWSPEVYQGEVEDLAGALGLSPGNGDNWQDTALLSKLTGGTAETIEEQNGVLSRALENNFTDPGLHEQAAVLLGAFILREHSGYFYDIRFPLSRMTAHLAMAHFLNGTNVYGINGQMASAMLLTLMGDESPALKQLDGINAGDAAVAAFVRALRTRNTGDYRPLEEAGGLSRVESIEWFNARAKLIGGASAWPKLSDEQKQAIDFVRIANQEGYSVEMGHQLTAEAIPLELQETSTVYELSRHEKLSQYRLVEALNELPERCFTKSAGEDHVCVIGWGQWADFLQQQLCHGVQQSFELLQNKWGVPDDARDFAAKCDQNFAGLRLYPFVRLMNSIALETYRPAMAESSKLTVATPQLVPAGCWNWLFHQAKFAPPFPADYDPHVDDWFVYNPPLGTVYDIGARLLEPTVTDRSDAVAWFEKLRGLAPYEIRIANHIIESKYNNHATYSQALDLYSNMMPYSTLAIHTVANTVYNQPAQYEQLLLQAAKLDSTSYYTLGRYALDHHEEDKAQQYYDQACDNDPDSVRAASMAPDRVQYYLKQGDVDKARAIADEGGEVYSSYGLQSEGLFFEMTSNYDEAYDWYSKVDERYNKSAPLCGFCLRYKILTGDSRYDNDVQKAAGKLFSGGFEQVSVADFHDQPVDGVLVKAENFLTTTAGLKAGNVIVAVYGVRVHNLKQYLYARQFESTPELDLIVWQRDAYREIKTSPPDHVFGADMVDYPDQ